MSLLIYDLQSEDWINTYYMLKGFLKAHMPPKVSNERKCNNFGVVAEWSKVRTAVPWPFMVWSTLSLRTYQLRFISWVFHVIFSFVHFITLYTLGGLRAFRKPLPYNMYLFNLQIENHILIKIFKKKTISMEGKIWVEWYYKCYKKWFAWEMNLKNVKV